MPKQVDKNAMGRLFVPGAMIRGKADGGSAGYVEGYASVWDNVDLGEEVMRRGAFAKSAAERVPAGMVKLMAKHYAYGGDIYDVVGTIVEAREDDYGLFFKAEFVPDDENAARARNLVTSGHVKTCSVGFSPVRWGYADVEGKNVVEYHECKLYEVTLTVVPMNEMAILTAAKSLGLDAGLDTLSQIAAIDSGSPEGRAQLKAIGAEKVRDVGATLRTLAGKVDSLLAGGADPSVALAVKAEVDIYRRKLDLFESSLG